MRRATRNDEDPPGPAPEPRPSKTQRKREMHELQDLGQQLTDLPPAQLRRIDLPERLREQIELARRITAREGLRRQLQYIGRLMRTADAEAIRARLAALTGKPEAAP
ncbi:MAG TPA: ribosome biogenesis factor YjgA [Burkholderiaceae bacterium]|jgi:ribosome-associated protein|nr:ribosome biogenesis factor YjgA [Burkholderiaceae bacterium]